MKRTSLLLLLGFVAFVLVVLWATIITSPAYEKCTKDAQRYDFKNPAEKNSPPMPVRDCFYHSIHESHGLLTAVATVLIGIFTATLWLATYRLAEMAERQEEAIRTHERAYLMCGGVFGVIDPNHNNYADWQRPKASYFNPPWRMAIANYGRTPGFITRIQWAVCPETEFPANLSVTKIIESGRFKMHDPQFVQEVIAPIDEKRKAVEYRHVEPGREAGTVFFGRIEYKDVFRKRCHSTFALRHSAEHTESIGTSYSEDWS